MCLSVIARNNNLYTYNNYVERGQTKKEQENLKIIYQYSSNWIVFITEAECVYFAVRTGSLNIIQAKLVL
jgi:hypothetical protein